MKKIRFNIESDSILFEQLDETALKEKCVIAACSNNKKYMLIYEQGDFPYRTGYIFRRIDTSRYGHSGHAETRKKAIETASGRDTDIYVFDSLAEFIKNDLAK